MSNRSSGLERAAHEAGNIDLIIADNQLSSETATEVAERFLSQHLDLVIEYQIDEQIGNRIMDRFRQANVPVIAVDIPMNGATFFGVDNYRAGHMAGVALGEWITAAWDGKVDHVLVLVEPRAGSLPAARIQAQLDGLQSILGDVPADKQITLDCGNTAEKSEKQVTAALEQITNAHHIAIISFNDDAAIGALTAARRLHRLPDVAIVGVVTRVRLGRYASGPYPIKALCLTMIGLSKMRAAAAISRNRSGENLLQAAFRNRSWRCCSCRTQSAGR